MEASGPVAQSGQKETEAALPKVVNYIRPAALEARQQSLPHYGVSSEPKLFGLWSTFPWHLRRHSAFLALHFGSIGLFALLLLGYSALSVWPLANTLRADNYRPRYTVIDPTSKTECPSQEKPYQAGNFALRMSLGNFCSSQTFSAPLDCCSICIADIPPDDPAPVCSLLPCPNSFTWNSEDQFLGACCIFNQDIGIDDTGNEPEAVARRREHSFGDETWGNEEPIKHPLIWCVVGVPFFCVWVLAFQYLQSSLAEASNRSSVHVSQYAVLLSNLGDVACDESRLEEFGRYYGDVVSTFYVRNYGRFLHKNTQIQQSRDLLKELRYLQQETQRSGPDTGTGVAIQGRFAKFPHSLYVALYKRYLCGLRSVDATLEALEARCEQLAGEVEELSRQPGEATGSAVVVFNWVQDAANMLHDHNLRNMLANLFVPPPFGRTFNIATRGRYAQTRKMAVSREAAADGQGVDEPRYVSVTRAPEPSDWWWENTRFGGRRVVRRRVISWVAYAALLALSLFVMINLNILATVETNTELTKALVHPASTSTSRRNLRFAWKQLSGWRWTVIKTVANLFFSELGLSAIQYLANYSLFYTRTQSVGSMVTKIAVFQLINSFAVPLAAFSWDHWMNNLLNGVKGTSVGRRLWYSTGGFVDIAFTIQLFNAVLPHVAFMFRSDDIFNLHFLSHMACTQTYVDKSTLPPPFRMELRMGQAITTVGLSVLYAPILPLSPFIGLLGMLVQYAVDQYMALRHSSRPRAFQVDAFTGANYVLLSLPLLQLGLIWSLYFVDVWWDISTYTLIGLIVWLVLVVVPFTNFFRQRQYTRWVQAGRPRLLDWAKLPGEKAGRWTNTMKLDNTGLGGPLWVNFDTFLPDVPSLDPQIFTDCIKPHFEYYSPPLERFQQPQARPHRYAYVEPVAAFHDALNKAAALPAKAVGAAGKAVGAAGKAVGAAGMAVLHFGSSHQGSQPSTANSDDTRKSKHMAATSRRGASASGSGLQPVSEPAEDSAEPKIDVLKTFGVPEFLPDF